MSKDENTSSILLQRLRAVVRSAKGQPGTCGGQQQARLGRQRVQAHATHHSLLQEEQQLVANEIDGRLGR